MSPAIDARFPWYPRIFRGRQVARSLHLLGMIAFVLFIIVHITMVIVERFPDNMGNIFLGKGTSLGIAIGIFALFVLVVVAVHVWATGISLKNPRLVQTKLGAVIEWQDMLCLVESYQDSNIQNQMLHLSLEPMVIRQIQKSTKTF